MPLMRKAHVKPERRAREAAPDPADEVQTAAGLVPARWTAQQVERSVILNLEPAVAAKGGQLRTFAECSLSGTGVVINLRAVYSRAANGTRISA